MILQHWNVLFAESQKNSNIEDQCCRDDFNFYPSNASPHGTRLKGSIVRDSTSIFWEDTPKSSCLFKFHIVSKSVWHWLCMTAQGVVRLVPSSTRLCCCCCCKFPSQGTLRRQSAYYNTTCKNIPHVQLSIKWISFAPIKWISGRHFIERPWGLKQCFAQETCHWTW